MAEANKKYFSSKAVPELLSRFENMIKNKTQYYFDINEFENLIDFYIDDNSFENAEKAIKLAQLQHPNSSSIQLKNGELLLDNGFTKQALAVSKQLEKIEPSESEIYILQANCYLKLNNIEKAELSFKKAIENTPNDLDEAYHDVGYFYLNAEKHQLALKYLKKAVNKNKKNYAAIFDYASLNFLTEKYDESIKWYKIYLKKYTFSEQAWSNLGNIYAILKKKDLAIEAFDYAISINNKFENPYLAKAEIHFQNGEYQKSIATYEKLIKLNDKNENVFFLIADCHQNLENYSEALKYYKKSIQLEPYFADAWNSMAIILFEMKDYLLANKFVEKAIEIDGLESEYWYLSAKINAEIGSFQNTCRSFKRTVNLDENHIDAWISYSEYCYQNNLIDSSIEALEEAVQSNKNNAYLHYLLAAFYSITKASKFANYNFQLAINLDFHFHEKFFLHNPLAKKNKTFLKMVNAKFKSEK